MIAEKPATKLSPRWKLMPAIAVLTVIALVGAGIAIAYSGESSYRAQKIDALSVQARILASTVTAALDFGDRSAAQEYVNALAANPEVLSAAIYDRAGDRFASYSRNADTSPPERLPRGGSHFEAERLVVTAPVHQHDTPLGAVYVQSVTEPLARRLLRYTVIAILVSMAAIVIGVLAFAQTALARANVELESRARDLTAQIDRREEAEAALRQAQKMEAIGQLTGGLAHDFNNLLQVILGSLERLMRHDLIRKNDILRRSVEMALGGAERGASLTQQLLAFGRRQPLAPKPFDVNRLVANMSDLLRRTLGESILVETRLGNGVWPGSADAHQLESALLNLAVNARDAMPRSGKLTIQTANVELAQKDAALGDDIGPGKYVMITVTDTGRGMSEEVAAKAVEPFFTTKGVGEGSGLGLSQVYGYVKQSGGHLKIRSAPGKGTSVALYLPRAVGEGTTEPEMPEASAQPVVDKKTVLVVEDEKIVLFSAVESLKELGYRVLSADRGASALEVLKSSEAIDVLFTDVVMPGTISGVDLAVEAMRLRPGIKVLLTSGYTRTALSTEHPLAEDVPLLQKPYRTQELAARLQKMTDAA